jgi:hypothetical protein
MPIGSTRKRKLYIQDFSKCNPRVAKQTRGKRRCLPDNIYSTIAKTLKSKVQNVYKLSSCGEGDDHCLLDKSNISESSKKELRKQYLRPRYPKQWINDPDMWLDNYNILAVMRQYQEAVPSFKFLGVFPIDFSAPNPYRQGGQEGGTPQCLYNELCTIQLKEEYKKGIRGIGIIFNLDPHYKGGSHWVGMYINLNKKDNFECSYFDSYGMKTPPLIARLMRSFTLQVPNIKLGFNARRFQFGGSECGMFSMYFIICMLQGIPFKEFCKDSVHDNMMLELRKVLFSK